MAADNNELFLQELANSYNSTHWYTYDPYYNTQQMLYPYVHATPQHHQQLLLLQWYRDLQLRQQQQQQWEQQQREVQRQRELEEEERLQREQVEWGLHLRELLKIDEKSAEEIEPQREEIGLDLNNPVTEVNNAVTEEEAQEQQWKGIERDILDLLNDDDPPVTERDDCQLAPFLETDNSSLVPERLVSFLEYDNSFLTPWNWNRDGRRRRHRSSSTSGQIRLEPGSFFSNNNLLFRLADELKSRNLSRINMERDEKSDDLSVTDTEQASDGITGSESPKN